MNFSTLPPLANLYEVRPTQTGDRFIVKGPATVSAFLRRSLSEALHAAQVLAGVRGGEVRVYDAEGHLVETKSVDHC